MIHNSFQTTYEELKPDEIAYNAISQTDRFQTTYEELKLEWMLKSVAECPASRLPMRN